VVVIVIVVRVVMAGGVSQRVSHDHIVRPA
jgi:hypothetical protein